MWKSLESFWQYFWETFKDSWVPKDADGIVQEFLKCSKNLQNLCTYLQKNHLWEKSLLMI